MTDGGDGVRRPRTTAEGRRFGEISYLAAEAARSDDLRPSISALIVTGREESRFSGERRITDGRGPMTGH